VAAGHHGHALDRLQIDAADSSIQRNAAVSLDFGNDLRNQELQHPAHPVPAGKLCDLDSRHRPWHAVGSRMHMRIDRAFELGTREARQ
jgi:hypothetical protein